MVSDPLVALARLDGVPSAVAAARDAVDMRLRSRTFRALPPDQLAAVRKVGAEANAELTGDAERWRTGALRVAWELDALSPLIRVSPAQAVARVHTLAASGIVADDSLGRLRGGREVAGRMQDLGALLTRPTDAPAVVLAAVAHAEIATLAAFGKGDDLVGRTVEHLVLMATGVDPAGAVPVEAGHLRLGSEYRHALEGYAGGGVTGVRGWLVHCARALQEAAGV